MIDFKNIEGIYFVGIGGIGMSALAKYFLNRKLVIAGYDRTESPITTALSEGGCEIIYNDDPGKIPGMFSDFSNKSRVIVVYTPAIPADSRILGFFREREYSIFKRSEILGELSNNTDTIAISGTHGKTTVSTMTAHLLRQSHLNCSAFLGGISKNYDSNLLIGESRFTVMEADEFDRSFHRLSPLIAIVTSLDADHLDIYGDRDNMIVAYNQFCAKIRKGGKLVVNARIRDRIIVPDGVECFTYGLNEEADFRSFDAQQKGSYYNFSIQAPGRMIEDLHFAFPGLINIENFTAAIAVALLCGVSEEEIRNAVPLFNGVKRRFDIRVNNPGHAYVDDYAHHPEEIKACIRSVKEYFSGRRITGIFQPHLYSRTRDHAEGFAAILDELDEPILLPIYPAREKPIEGVSSEMILERMKSPSVKIMAKEDIPGKLDMSKIDVLVTIGAGDIDTLVKPIEEKMKSVVVK